MEDKHLTQDQKMEGYKIAILVTDNFEQVELTGPRRALEDMGATTVIVAPKGRQVQGVNNDQKGDSFPVDMTLDQASPDEFDGLLLPGGAMNADHLRVIPEAQRFVQEIDAAGKPVAVICHGPWLLVSAGLVKDRSLTSYHTLADDIRNAGGNWLDQEVVTDRNWVSSRGPQDLEAFDKAILQLFPKLVISGHNVRD